MKPVIFVKHPNQNRFIGTFDMANLHDWWLSEPLPAGVAEVVDVDWVYAQYHVCVCRMEDGTYSIIRTKDYGQSWYVVLNLAEIIYSITRIDYGWLLAATESGWYESTRSGLEDTWSKVSYQAPGCKTVVNLGENILVAHDGSCVWRSTNVARTWSKTLNCHSLYYKRAHGGYTTQSYSGSVYPALAGFGEQVMAGAGPHLMFSDDGGQSWTIPWGWDPPGADYCGNTWRGKKTCNNSSISPYYGSARIIQIIHTDYRPRTPGVATSSENSWMIRVYIPQLGVVRCLATDYGTALYIPVFDQPFNGYGAGAITAYQVLRPHSDEDDIMVFSSDPSPRYSTDGGWSWAELNPDSFDVYEGDPTQEISTYVNPFLEEDFADWVWSGSPCHNGGRFIFREGCTRRALSYDCDFVTKGVFEANSKCDMDTLLARVRESGTNMDVLAKAAFDDGYLMDQVSKKAFDKAYLGHAFIQDTFELGENHDMVLVHRYIWPWEMDILHQKMLSQIWYNDILQQKAISDEFEMAVYLVEDRWDDIVNDIVKTMPQVWKVEPPDVPADVLDSRSEDFDDVGGDT